MTSIFAIIIIIIGTLIGTVGAIFLKKAAKGFSLSIKGIFKNKYLIRGVFIYGFSSIIFIPALKFGELSVLYPFVSLSYVWITLASKIFLREKINRYKYAGIVFIIIGVSLIGLGS